MKKNTLTAVVISLFTAFGLHAQQPASNQPAKDAFIKNGVYLSKNPSSSPVHTDSLRGFNEDAIKKPLLAQGVEMTELLGYIEIQKREFIKNKYNLNPPVVVNTVGQTPPNGGAPTGGKTIGGGGNQVNIFPCVNEDFEATPPGVYTTSNAVTGWTVESRNNNGSCTNPNPWNPGSSEFEIVATPLLGWPGTGVGAIAMNVPHSPLGGTVVAKLGNFTAGTTHMVRLMQTFPVTQANSLFQFAYAGYWQDGGSSSHPCCPAGNAQPGINVAMLSCSNTPLACSSLSLFPGQGCQSSGVTYSPHVVGSVTNQWTNWQVKFIDLTPYIGSCVTIVFINQDCSLSGHWASTLIDVRCGGQLIGQNMQPGPGGTIAGPVSFCAGSNQAIINAPNGYSSYQWIAPGGFTVPAPQGTMSTYTVVNPIPGSVYTVNLVSASGCQYVSTNTIVFSQVNIAGIGSTSTCPNGASGSASVVGNGSGTGYTYTWTNASNSVISSASVATSLAPGIYSITISGLGASGCGTQGTTVEVGVSPPVVNHVIKPYCMNEAYLVTHGGTNYRWYGPGGIITGTAGALPHFTVNSQYGGPSNGQIWAVTYTTTQGCKDSTRFTLAQSQPGLLTVPLNGIKLICSGANNGTANIVMQPAQASPPGFNTFSVVSTGTTQTYNQLFGPTFQNAQTVHSLTPGTYTVIAFDGSCKYSTSFTVPQLTWDFDISLNNSGVPTASACSGGNVTSAFNFTSNPNALGYTYSWTPTTWIPGGSAILPSPIFNPTAPIGVNTTIVYSVQVTPNIVSCPRTKTIAITAINPPTPTISPIQPLCNTFSPHQIQVSPPGGTFVTTPTNAIGSTNGIISPTFANIGTNTFTYSINVWQCSAQNTATYEVSQFRTAALTASVAPLCVTNPVVNLMNIVQSTVNGVWSGPGVQGNIFNPAASGISYTSPNSLMYNTVSNPNPTVCPHSSSLQINVTNTLVPTISPIAPFCNNAPTFTMTVSPAGGTWSGQNVSAAGVITPSNIPQAGNFVANYSIVIGPCQNFNSVSYNVSRFNPATITSPIGQICYNDQPVNLMSFVQSTVNGTWSGFGVGDQVAPNFFNPANQATGTYTLTYNTTSSPLAGLCDDVKTTTLSVLNPPKPTIIPIQPVCSRDAAIQLSVSPNTGQWTSSSYMTNTGLFTPSNAAVGHNIVQYIIGTQNCNKSDQATIIVEGFVSAEITQALPDLCNTSPAISLAPFTSAANGVWFGPGISGSNFNPSISGQGQFVLLHKTASSPSGLCPDQSTVAITVYSLQPPEIESVPNVCNTHEPIQLTPIPVGGLFGGVNTTAVDNGGLFQPASAAIGANIINYSITSGPCIAFGQTTITVEEFVPASFTSELPTFCKTNNPVNMNSFVLHPNAGDWSGDGIVGSMFNPQLANTFPAINQVTYRTYSQPSGTLCPDQITVYIKVIEVPEVAAFANKSEGCAPLEVILNTPNGNVQPNKAVWHLGDGSAPKEGVNVSHIYTSPGSYSVLLSFWNEACNALSEVKVPINVYPAPQADFAFPDEVLISSPSIQLTNMTKHVGENRYTWSVDNMATITDSSAVHAKIEFPQTGKYHVLLQAENRFACKSEVQKVLEVKNDFNIFIPTSFSPNFDEVNDVFIPVFTPYGLDTKSFEMEIFDRWGHTLYRTRDITKGWDGSVNNKGEPLKEEVYVYRIKYRDLDGNSYTKMGHLTLIK